MKLSRFFSAMGRVVRGWDGPDTALFVMVCIFFFPAALLYLLIRTFQEIY